MYRFLLQNKTFSVLKPEKSCFKMSIYNVLKGKLEAFRSRITGKTEVLHRNSKCQICVNDYIRGVKRNFGMENFSFFTREYRIFLFPTQRNWEFCVLDRNH